MSTTIIEAKKAILNASIPQRAGYCMNDFSSTAFEMTRNPREPIAHANIKNPHTSCAIFVGLAVGTRTASRQIKKRPQRGLNEACLVAPTGIEPVTLGL